MERYLGADVHAASVTFSVLNKSGRQLRRDVIETNGKALVGYLRQIPGNKHLCIEEGEMSQWLVEILSPYLDDLVVYRSQWRPGTKSDAIDAHGLAEKLRTGQVDRGRIILQTKLPPTDTGADSDVELDEAHGPAAHLLPGPQALADGGDRGERLDGQIDVDLAARQVVDDQHVVALVGQVDGAALVGETVAKICRTLQQPLLSSR